MTDPLDWIFISPSSLLSCWSILPWCQTIMYKILSLIHTSFSWFCECVLIDPFDSDVGSPPFSNWTVLLLVVLVDPSDRDVLPQLLHLLLLLLKICLQLGVSTLCCLKEGEEKTGWKKSTNEVLLKSKWRLVMRLIWYYETSFPHLPLFHLDQFRGSSYGPYSL